MRETDECCPPPRHVLVVDRDPEVRKSVPLLTKTKDPSLVANVVSTISDALRELRKAGYDAVVLRVDSPKELSFLIRIKESAPETPVIALLPTTDQDLTRLAEVSGADEIQVAGPESTARIAEIGRLLESSDALVRRSRAVSRRGRQLLNRMTLSVARSQPLNLRRLQLAQEMVKGLWPELVPLVVEDDTDQAMLLSHSFGKLGIPLKLPILKTGEEAIAYLSNLDSRPGREKRHPPPTLVIVDLHLPVKNGHEVIHWIRSEPRFATLVVFLLTSSTLREDHEHALMLGADATFQKPISLDELRNTALHMAIRWGLITRAYQSQ